MKILGIDLELGNPFKDPQGAPTKPENTWLTEVGMVLWDTDLGQPVELYSKLVNEGKGVSEDASRYTKITEAAITQYGEDPKRVTVDVFQFLIKADMVIAHNARKADKPWLYEFLKRYKKEHENVPDLLWVDTLTDVEYPEDCVARNQVYLAGYHLFCNPFPHRAVTDVLTMFNIFNKYDLQRSIAIAQSPSLKLIAVVSFEDKDLAKNAGFRWDPEDKIWIIETREVFVLEGKYSNLPFVALVLSEHEEINSFVCTQMQLFLRSTRLKQMDTKAIWQYFKGKGIECLMP